MDPIKIPIVGVDRFSRVFGNATKGIAGISDRIGKFQKNFAKAGALLTVGGGLLTVGTGLASLPKTFIDQEHGLARISVATNITGKALADLDRAIQGTRQSANQFDNDVGSAAVSLLKMQFTADETISMLDGIGKAATATGVPMEVLANTAGVFRDRLGIMPQQMGAAFDQMIDASKRGRVNLEDMAGGMTRMAGIAGLIGIKGPDAISQIGAALQITARGANSSSEAIMSLEKVFEDLGKDKVSKTLRSLEDLGLIGSGNLKQYQNILKTSKDPLLDLVRLMDRITGGDIQKLKVFFQTKESLVGIQDLIKNVREYGTLRGQIAEADGVVQRDFDTMMDTTTEKWKQFKIQLENTALPYLEPGVIKLNGLLGVMNKNALAVKGTIYAIGALLGGGALLVGLSAMAGAISNIMLLAVKLGPLLPAIGAGLATWGLPLLAVAGALTTAYAAFKGISVLLEMWNARSEAKDRRSNLKAQLESMGKSPEQVDALMEKFDSSLAGKASKPVKLADVQGTPAQLSSALSAAREGKEGGEGKIAKGEVIVKFQGAPAGTRVESKAGRGMRLGTELGLAF